MKMVMLGAPRRRELDCWKDDIAEAGVSLGWNVVHFNARGAPVDDVIRECRDADMLLWARTHGHEPFGDEFQMLRTVEEFGCATVALHLDLYWGIPVREHRLKTLAWATCQYMFTADGGNQEKFAKIGINHYWCPPPMGSLYYGRQEPKPDFPFTAVFVGSHVPTIHGAHRKQLLLWARRRWGRKFTQYGVGRSRAYGPALNEVYASAHVTLGDSAPAPYYWSDRVPRTLGRGGLLTHPATEGMVEQGFTDDVLITHKRFDYQELDDKISALTPKRRAEMIDNSLTLIKERHMWTHRLQTIQETVFNS